MNRSNTWKPWSGGKVIQIISEIYDILEPAVACNLVNPNVVLTIAGIKPYADVHWIPYTKDTEGKILKANAIIKKYDLELDINLDENSANIADGFITSRKGLERITHSTEFKWVPKYESVTGKEGHAKWYRETLTNLKDMQKKEELTGDQSLKILFEGIKIGYPDQAILDYEEAVRLNNRAALIFAELDYPKEYWVTTAVPNFHYYPEHSREKSIENWVNSANKVFNYFYNSKWYNTIVKTPTFFEAIDKNRLAQEKGLSLIR